MKFFHISDLHIGIKIYGMSQIEEQRHILNTIVQNAVDERIDGIILAGDIYDKQTPSAEGVVVFDEFLTALSKNNISVFMIWGNHDSKERIAFGSKPVMTTRSPASHVAALESAKVSVAPAPSVIPPPAAPTVSAPMLFAVPSATAKVPPSMV